jgi:dTDP-glucose 4,6-dehydratase
VIAVGTRNGLELAIRRASAKSLGKIISRPDSALTDHCAERLSLDCSKLKHELGWARAWEFERGLVETIGWYQANRPWLEEILSGEYQKYFDRHYLRRAETLAAPGPAGS